MKVTFKLVVKTIVVGISRSLVQVQQGVLLNVGKAKYKHLLECSAAVRFINE